MKQESAIAKKWTSRIKLVLRWYDEETKKECEEIVFADANDPNFGSSFYDAAYYFGFYHQYEVIEITNEEFNYFGDFSYVQYDLIQAYFKHDVSNSSGLGIYVETVTIEHPIITPKPKKGLLVELIWSVKKSSEYKEESERFFLKDVDIWTFSFELSLTNECIPWPAGNWGLDGWLGQDQLYYLTKLYDVYGKYIKHVYDDDQYRYSLCVLEEIS